MTTFPQPRLLLSFAALAAVLAATPAAAESFGDSFQVTARVIAKCTIVAGDIVIGDYDPMGANLGAPKDGSGTITVNCTRGASYNVALGTGLNSTNAGYGASRAMKHSSAAEYLSYELYQDSDHSILWGEGADVQAGVGVGHATGVPLIVYAQVPAAQEPTQGDYADTVSATINF